MLEKVESIEGLKANFSIFALAIKKQPEGHYHCGCLFLEENDDVSFLHLASDYALLCNPAPPGYYWHNIDMSPTNKKYLAALCGCIKEQAPAVPYGLDPNGISFNQNGSIAIVNNSGTGLTCATFILTLLKTYGFSLLEEDTWPENENDRTQRKIIIGLKLYGHNVTSERIERNSSCIGMRFFFPQEVVGASFIDCAKWPVNYETSRQLAQLIEQYA